MRKLNLLLVFMLLTVMQVLAQRTITGTVTGMDDGKGIPGVSVSIKGTTMGSLTDIDGKYSLKVPKEATTLIFSFVGMKKLEVAITTSNVMDVKLQPEAVDVEGVVVVGYGVMKKSDLTGSVGKVNVSDLKKVTSIDAAQSMQGRMAGVNVISNSGNPGAGVTIRVRGIGTFYNSDPLYVVDGFAVSDISHIAPTDIESMEVLKDASATAIYGSRGANGVILVKTRSGTKGKKFEVQLNVLGGVSQVTKTLKMADATQFATARKELGTSDDMIQYVLDQQTAGNYLHGTDWQKEIFNDAINQRYNLTLSGGTDSYTYDHGMTYSKQEGIVKGSNLDKIMFHTNNNFELTKKIKLGINLNYVWYQKPGEKTDFYSGIIPGALRADPISAAWDSYKNFYGQIYYSQAITNPALGIWQNSFVNNNEDRFLGNIFVQIDDIFIKGLSFRSQFGKQLSFYENKSYSPKFNITATQQNADATLYQQRYNGNSWSNTDYFSYNHTVSKLSINATLGVEVQANKGSDIWAKGYDVPIDADLQYLGTHKDVKKFDIGGSASENRLASGFVRGNFSWDSKYLITATYRADGSSKFIADKRWGYFPSFSAGWNIANESFMAGMAKTISVLKVRAGWGVVGNQSSAGNYDYVSSVVPGYIYAFNGDPIDGAIQRQLANKELSWESGEQFNLGADFGFFTNKLSGSVDYFIKNTKNMILALPIPEFVGKQRPNVNAGTMTNKGMEFTVNYANSVSDFKYNVGLNLTFIKNEVTSLAGTDPIPSGGVPMLGNTTKTEEGREIAYFFGYKTGGIFHTAEELAAHSKDGVPIQPLAALGDVIYEDLNGDGKIDENDKTYLGSATPKFTGGFNVNLSYKNFDMVLFLNGSYGSEIVNAMYANLYSSRMNETNISQDMALNHWSATNPTSNLPRLVTGDPNLNDTRFSDRAVENGSYLRVKNLQIGYSLSETTAKVLHMKNFRIFASVDNMFTFTKYTGLDPELFGLYGNPFFYGVDMVNYPQPRTYSLGINLTF